MAAMSTRRSLFALVLLSMAFMGWVLLPLAKPIFLAAVFAAALAPLRDPLRKRLGPAASSAALTLGLLLAVAGPMAYIGATVAAEAPDALSFVKEKLESAEAKDSLERLPGPLRSTIKRALSAGKESGHKDVGAAVGAARSVLSATGGAAVRFVLLLAALFFLLKDGDDLLDWILENSPLPRRDSKELLGDFRSISSSIITSALATAGVQALAAMVGYLLAGVPHVPFFTFASAVASLVPVVGAAMLSCALAAVLLFSGKTGAAIFLAVWSVGVVGVVDNIFKAWFLKGRMELHGGLVLFFLIGGIAAFGGVGLLAGPLALGFFLSALRLYRRESKPE
jgi:predicted PurR-regulated permease PerM